MSRQPHSALTRELLFAVYLAGASTAEAARRGGVSQTWAHKRLSEAGLLRRTCRRYTAATVRQVVDAYRRGLTYEAIADEVERTTGTRPGLAWMRHTVKAQGVVRTRRRAQQVRRDREAGRGPGRRAALVSRAVEIVAEGGTVAGAARELGLPVATLGQWMRAAGVHLTHAEAATRGKRQASARRAAEQVRARAAA